MVSKQSGNLNFAHQGYQYQDLITAYTLVQGLIHKYECITVDQKVVADDRWDDLEIISETFHSRKQVKHSSQKERELEERDFTTQGSLSIDRLVNSYVNSGEDAADEYRLICNWQAPNDTNFQNYLEKTETHSTIKPFKSKTFRLKGELVWPEGENAVWDRLNSSELNREQFIKFCKRFIIELELPGASFNLFSPGPLEEILIEELKTRIGIGKYPNQDRKVEDFAAQLITISNDARGKGETLTPEEIESRLNLRTDYGRVSQEFPIDFEHFLDRKKFRPGLIKTAIKGVHQIVIGPPGIGKSWELTRLVEDLKEQDIIVARHYCYLEPGDEKVEKRITSDVFFGNLIAEITDAEPRLRQASTKYSAGPEELEKILHESANISKQIVLIIDGIDHISRVLEEAKSISESEADIIDQLASLRIPDNVSLIIGSQPGDFLEPLRDSFSKNLISQNVPEWDKEEIIGLAKKFGTEEVLEEANPKKIDSIFNLLVSRSEGNPLYATYLSKELVSGIKNGKIVNAIEWFENVPDIEGDISNYYAHLYKHASKTERAIADILGVIDFGITKAEFNKILPAPNRNYVDEALNHLRPILINIKSQGGIRIFHESFRRFIREELSRNDRSISNAIDPIVTWLMEKGFYSDAKSYRFLLPALRRAERIDQLLALVDTNFVSKSVSNGHSFKAIERNLALATDVAAKNLRWKELIRCIELNRSAHTCFEEKLYDPLKYWRTYLDLFGSDALVDRLLLDGKTTLNAEEGLILCSLADDSGTVPPWREYLQELELSGEDEEDNELKDNQYYSWKEKVSLSKIHGKIILDGYDNIHDSIVNFLVEDSQEARENYIRNLAYRINKNAGDEAIQQIFDDSKNSSGSSQLTNKISGLLYLGQADNFFNESEYEKAKSSAKRAVEYVESPIFVYECYSLGVSSDTVYQYHKPLSAYNLGINNNIDEKVAFEIEGWIASSRLLALKNIQEVNKFKEKLDGEGWYLCWLRFVLEISKAAALSEKEKVYDIVEVFEELTRDVRPFHGQPRACDLYHIQDIILKTIKSGFSLLNTKKEWEQVLGIIEKVLDKTSTSLQGAPSGPLYVDEILIELQSFCLSESDPISNTIESFAKKQIEKSDLNGTYFEYHAERYMAYAKILEANNKHEKAKSVWEDIGVLLSAYGQRKDITIFELLESVTALKKVGKKEALKALEACQQLTEAVVRHTDGKETRHAPITWYKKLFETDITAALSVLADSMSVRNASTGSTIENAIQHSATNCSDLANPIICEAIQSTKPFEVEYEGKSGKLVNKRLDVIKRIIKIDKDYGEELFEKLTAKVLSDSKKTVDLAIQEIIKFAHKYSLPLPDIENEKNKNQQNNDVKNKVDQNTSQIEYKELINNSIQYPFFESSSSIDLMTGIRNACSSWSLSEEEKERFVNSFGFRLLELLQGGKEDEVIRYLRFFTRSYFSSSDSKHPVTIIAEGFKRFGYKRIAAIAYSLGYVKSRGGGGWSNIGGEEHENALLKGLKLDRELTLNTLAHEISYQLRNVFYHSGFTKHLIKRIASWGQADLARDCWWSAYEVINHRLPSRINRVGIFERLNVADIPKWSVEEGLLEVLLRRVHHPNLYRKIAALYGISTCIDLLDGKFGDPLNNFLRKDSSILSVIIILQVLLLKEEEPYLITESNSDTLQYYSKCDIWALRKLSKRLLNRVGVEQSFILKEIPDSDDSLTNDQVEGILKYDPGDRIEKLSLIWPKITRLTAGRFHNLFGDLDFHKYRCKETFQMAYGRDGKTLPATPVLHWQQELFETAIQEALNGIDKKLWQDGKWDKKREDKILEEVLPNIKVHLGIHASRIKRPNYPDPQNINEDKSLNIVEIQENLYHGWKRVGYIEHQWIKSDESKYSAPSNLIRVFSGVIAEPLSRNEKVDFPFGRMPVNNWWTNELPEPQINPTIKTGPLMGLRRIIDQFGDVYFLVPPLALRVYINLNSVGFSKPLTWRDNEGNKAVVLRSWRVRDTDQFHAEPLKYKGMDLIMRPDIYTKMEKLTKVNLRELTIKMENSIR